jgi:hypothetical protein
MACVATLDSPAVEFCPNCDAEGLPPRIVDGHVHISLGVDLSYVQIEKRGKDGQIRQAANPVIGCAALSTLGNNKTEADQLTKINSEFVKHTH